MNSFHESAFNETKFINSSDIFYMLNRGHKDNNDGLIIFAYTAFIAAIIIPQIPQVD